MLTPWKKRLIVLGLWAPLGLYVAHIVAEMSDRLAPPLPTSKLPDGGMATKLRADAKTRAEEARAELQAAAGFDSSKAEGPFHDSLNNRAVALSNARPFLDPAPIEPKTHEKTVKFYGAKAKEFEDLYQKEADLRAVERRIEAWLKNPAPKTAWEDFRKSYIEPYESAGATPRMIASYKFRGRHKILTAFADDLGKQYDDTVKNPGLPLAGAKELIGQTKELFEMCKAYQDEASAASGTGEPTGGHLDEEVKTLQANWIARRALLEEFDVDPTRYTPAQAQEWFKKVNAYCNQLKSDTMQTLIRTKSQEFCSAVLPNKLALDEYLVVKVDNNEMMEKRSKIKARYRYLQEPYFRDNDPVLTTDPTRLNEYTAEKPEFFPPGAKFNAFTRDGSPVNVKPTPLSEAAEAYCRARQDVMGVGGWTRGTVRGMIARADNIATPGPGDTHIWNKLSLVGATGEYKVYQRLKIVEKAIEDCRDLFPDR